MASIRIDGREYEVEDGKNLLEAVLGLGLDLPYFCWHPAMGSIGACRQCAVVQYQNAEDDRGRIVMGCMTPVSDGAIFSLDGDKARGFREAIVESLMLNHPHDCPVCAEGGECHLQDMTVMVGHRDRHYRGRKNTHRNQYLGPLIHHEMNRCITCYRCTRFYQDYAGGTDLAALAAHDHVYFGRHEEGVLQSEFAGNLVEVCPTGVFTDKTLVHDYTRKWDLQSAPSVCTGCAVGCNTLPGERYGRLKRVHNRFNAEVNGYFLCDRGRFGAGFVNHASRLEYPGLKDSDGRYNALDHHAALDRLRQWCSGATLAGIGSPRASVEANYLLRRLVGGERFAPGFGVLEQGLVNRALALQQESRAVLPDLRSIESADLVIILGEDVTNTAPRMALALRQSVRNRAYEMAAELNLAPWQDAAIRNLAQDQRSPLYIATTARTPLDDVATARLSLAPAGIAALGETLAAAVRGEDSADEHVRAVLPQLLAAKRPLVVSGTGAGSAAVLDAAAQLADALCQRGQQAMLSLVVPEANSLGQALLAGPAAPTLADLAQQGGDTLLVLENDLFRRAPEAEVTALLAAWDKVIVLDGLDNRCTSAGDLVLPSASFAESEGTLVSLEGRAQRHFPVFPPAAERHPAWYWLLAGMKEMGHCPDLHYFDDITAACAAEIPALAGITAAAPDHHFRNVGVRIPRQPPRYSGRTAMRANISVHEPKQPEDEESALGYTMEGLNRDQPGALLPYVWSPGWNSNQSLHRFQSEVGGPLRGGTAGVRLLQPGGTSPGVTSPGGTSPGGTSPGGTSPARTAPLTASAAAAEQGASGDFELVPRYRIFGSDELSVLSPGIAELVLPAYIELNSAAAAELGVADGDGVTVGDGLATLEVRIEDSLAPGCAGYAAGHPGTGNLQPGRRLKLSRATGWQRQRPQVIGSDRAGGDRV